jgi:hypothetical protein
MDLEGIRNTSLGICRIIDSIYDGDSVGCIIIPNTINDITVNNIANPVDIIPVISTITAVTGP